MEDDKEVVKSLTEITKKLEDINKTIREVYAKPEETEQAFDKDIELQKIQVIESNYQGLFNFRASIIAGGLVGAFILIATVQFQHFIPLVAGFIGDLIVILAMPYLIRELKKTRDEQNTFINGLLLRVENREKLESIDELLKQQRKGAKKEERAKILKLS